MHASADNMGILINGLVDILKKQDLVMEDLTILQDEAILEMITDLKNNVPVSELTPEEAYKRGVLVGRASVYMELVTGRKIPTT